MNYTVLGDNVNLASRLEGANKIYDTRIIISKSTYERVSDKFISRPLDLVAVKGKEQSAMIYELIGRKADGAPAETIALCEEFSRMLESYFRKDWDEALRILSDLSNRFPTDRPTHLYIERCKIYRQDPPEADWTGITYMDSK
jgi:adenylate cyclase